MPYTLEELEKFKNAGRSRKGHKKYVVVESSQK